MFSKLLKSAGHFSVMGK
jgi:malate dehydrogenase